MADGSAERLPSANRGVRRSGSEETALRTAKDSPSRTWAGIDWLAGSVDLWDLLQACGWVGQDTTLDGLAMHLRAYGPKRKPQTIADQDGQLVVAPRVEFVRPDQIVGSIAQAAFAWLFGGTGLVLASEAGPGSFYAYKYLVTNVWGDVAGMIELGGELTQRKGGRPSLRFELTGLGCAIFEQRGDASADHAQRWCALRAQLERVGTMLTRVDTAFDDFDGKRNLDLVRCMYALGEFDYSFAGKRHRPQSQEITKTKGGSTFYLGHSTSEKQLRVYEKGRQLGDEESPWTRWELQLRSSSRKRLSLEILSDPMAHMRGAFACLDFVATCMARIEVTKEATKATAKSVMRHVRRQYGATLNQVLRLAPSPDDLAKLIQALSVDKVPKWAKRGRLSWEDVPCLVDFPATTEGDSHEHQR